MKETIIKGLAWSSFAAVALGSCYLNNAAGMPSKEKTHQVRSDLTDGPILIAP